MLFVRWMAIAMLVAAPVAVAAQENSTPKDPVSPAAAASPLQYKSAFAGYRPMPEQQEVDSKVWRAANQEMADLGGHAGHIQADAASAPGHLETDNAPASTSANGSPAHHGGHGMDHKTAGK
jgi:hypothetical protein